MTGRIARLVLASIAVASVMLAGCGTVSEASVASAAPTTQAGASAEPEPREYGRYSLVMPEGYEESPYRQPDGQPSRLADVFMETSGLGSFRVRFLDCTAEEVVEKNCNDAMEFEDLGDIRATTGITYRAIRSRLWSKGYYVADWDDGCIEIMADYATDEETQAFLDGLRPVADGQPWQEETSPSS